MAKAATTANVASFQLHKLQLGKRSEANKEQVAHILELAEDKAI